MHHRALLSQELLTGWEVPMDGRVPIAAGDVRRAPDGDVGIHIEEFDEVVALQRWQTHEFLEIERQIARRWRAELADDGRDRIIGMLRNILPAGRRIPDLSALKSVIDDFCESAEREVVALALDVVGVPEDAARLVLARWGAAGSPPFPGFAPYTAHVFKVELLYYLGIERGFISGERPSNKADVAYLYYLPFSMLFTSGDNLHRRTVPLFLRADQSFVEARELKDALGSLDRHYAALPDEIKALGVMGFAHSPPLEFYVVDSKAVEAKDPDALVSKGGLEAWGKLLRQRVCGITWHATEIVGEITPESPVPTRREALSGAGAWLGTLPARLALEQEDAVRIVAERCGYSPEASTRSFRARFWTDLEPNRGLARSPVVDAAPEL